MDLRHVSYSRWAAHGSHGGTEDTVAFAMTNLKFIYVCGEQF